MKKGVIMRKRSINNLFENILWYSVYLLPIIMFFVITIVMKKPCVFSEIFDFIGLNIASDSVVYTALVSIFGVDGIFPMFVSSDIFIYSTYLIYVFIVRLLIEFLLFIPKLSQKWLLKFAGGDD